MVDRLRPAYSASIDFYVYGDVNSDQRASEYARRQGVEAIPTMVLVDTSGSEVRRVVGGLDEAGLRELLESAR